MNTPSNEIETILNKVNRQYKSLEADLLLTSKRLYASEVESGIYQRLYDRYIPSVYIMSAPYNIHTIAVSDKKFTVDIRGGWESKLTNLKEYDILLLHHTGMGVGEYAIIDHVETQSENESKQIVIYLKDIIFQTGYISTQGVKQLLGKEVRFNGTLTLINLDDGLKIIRQIYKNIA